MSTTTRPWRFFAGQSFTKMRTTFYSRFEIRQTWWHWKEDSKTYHYDRLCHLNHFMLTYMIVWSELNLKVYQASFKSQFKARVELHRPFSDLWSFTFCWVHNHGPCGLPFVVCPSLLFNPSSYFWGVMKPLLECATSKHLAPKQIKHDK